MIETNWAGRRESGGGESGDYNQNPASLGSEMRQNLSNIQIWIRHLAARTTAERPPPLSEVYSWPSPPASYPIIPARAEREGFGGAAAWTQSNRCGRERRHRFWNCLALSKVCQPFA